MKEQIKFYKAKELAEILGINDKTVYRLGREGLIDRVKVGRSVRFIMPDSDAEKKNLDKDSSRK